MRFPLTRFPCLELAFGCWASTRLFRDRNREIPSDATPDIDFYTPTRPSQHRWAMQARIQGITGYGYQAHAEGVTQGLRTCRNLPDGAQPAPMIVFFVTWLS